MLRRILLVLEIILLCAHATALLCIGVLCLPITIIFLFDSKLYSGEISVLTSPAIIPIITVAGLWGFFSLLSLAWGVLVPRRKWAGRPMQWFGISLGIASCGLFFFYVGRSVIFAGPIAAYVHLLCLSKNKIVST